mmetsp:Transcript_10348/g.25723  ORF Transcript_10348/g.25723 Transcript_10348/m.25723 type:complete len:263 (-) Transcript_10348:323-1111(-)
MELVVTPSIEKLLETASTSQLLSQEARSQAAGHKGKQTVPWRELKSLVTTLREKGHEPTPYLHELCKGSSPAAALPPAPKPPNPELEARRRQLQANLDNMQYASMVADITQSEREAEAMKGETLPTLRAQYSFGAHVLVTMFTLFSLGYYGSKQFLGYDELWAGLLGVLGLSFGMLMETVLLIIRTNRPEKSLEDRFPELFDPARWNKKKGAAKSQSASNNAASGVVSSGAQTTAGAAGEEGPRVASMRVIGTNRPEAKKTR